ncbi:taste receptor type 2 member 9-like [Dendropsophus ebraccatus]|uniref:taste receptor type 2 member 9-like n=1 Tax=Dendropsophus ebraccatus TaxID=150705 RepID=UPI0038313981
MLHKLDSQETLRRQNTTRRQRLDICIFHPLRLHSFFPYELRPATQSHLLQTALIMVEVLEVIFLVYLVISWISGTILNSWIGIIYLQDWRRHRSAGICDQITFIMSSINVVLQFTLTMDGMFQVFRLYSKLSKDYYICVSIFMFFLCDISSWHTTWLAISYFLRLVSVSHPFFLRLRSCFPSSALPLLLASVLGSFLINLPFFFTTHVALLDFPTNESYTSMYTQKYHPSSILLHVVFSCCLPIIFTLPCIGLSVKSLLGHVWKMRQSSSQYSFSPQLQALVQAAGTMILRVVTELTFNLIMTAIISMSYEMPLTIVAILWFLVMIFPTVQSIILIMGSPRLRSRLLGHGEPSTM